MLDYLEARNGKKSHQNHLFLLNPTFSSHSLLSKRLLHKWEVSKTKCGLIPLIHYKVIFGTSLNPIFHFCHFNFLFHFHYHLIYLVLKLILIRPLGPYFTKFQICPFSLGFISGFNQFLNLAYNIQSYAHIFISHLSFSQFNNLSIFPKKPKFGSIIP